MSKNEKFFHYRNAFKSDHLASADIEELQENNNGIAILTLDKVEYFENRKVAGRKVDKCLIASFKEKNTKPMVVNAHNSNIIRDFIDSSNINEWINLNLKIELYVNYNVSMSGSKVSGIRIRQTLPVIELQPITDLNGAFEWLQKEGNTLEKLKQIKAVSKKQEEELKKMKSNLKA
jgi:hypothetical protein